MLLGPQCRRVPRVLLLRGQALPPTPREGRKLKALELGRVLSSAPCRSLSEAARGFGKTLCYPLLRLTPARNRKMAMYSPVPACSAEVACCQGREHLGMPVPPCLAGLIHQAFPQMSPWPGALSQGLGTSRDCDLGPCLLRQDKGDLEQGC